jgi:hypothetical protein
MRTASFNKTVEAPFFFLLFKLTKTNLSKIITRATTQLGKHIATLREKVVKIGQDCQQAARVQRAKHAKQHVKNCSYE